MRISRTAAVSFKGVSAKRSTGARTTNLGKIYCNFSLEAVPRYLKYRSRPKTRTLSLEEVKRLPIEISGSIRSAPRLVLKTLENYQSLIFDDPQRLFPHKENSLLTQSRASVKMKCYLQVISTPTADSRGTCLLLHFDDKRYLFGQIHEGLQRAIGQQRLGVTKISELFVTGKTCWDSLGGMIGIILTVADSVQTQAKANAEAAKQTAERRNALLRGPINDKQRQKLNQDKLNAARDTEGPPSSMTIHGGGNILHTIAAGRKYIFRQGLPIYVNEYDHVSLSELSYSKPTWSDQNIRVWALPTSPRKRSGSMPSSPARKRSFRDYLEGNQFHVTQAQETSPADEEPHAHRLQILRSVVSDMFDSDWRLDALVEKKLCDVQLPAAVFVRNPDSGRIEKYKGPLPGQGIEVPDIDVLVRRPWPGALVANLPNTEPSDVSMSYIIRNHPQRGKFLASKAKELKVKRGPDYRKLTLGESVIAEDGQKITPEQVLEPSKAGNGVFIADVPSPEYLVDLLSAPHWDSSEIMEGVHSVVWLLGPGVSEDPSFQEFIQSRSGLQHILSSSDHNANRLTYDAGASSAIRHFQIDSERYAIPKHNNEIRALPERLSTSILADRGLMLHLEPSFKIDQERVTPPLNTQLTVDNTPKSVIALAKEALSASQSDSFRQEIQAQNLPCPDAEILTLGTGSALPSKYRNVSATLLRVPGVGSYLFDCGENTLGQLARIYDPNELLEVLRDLKMIWISHLHADHHLGIASVIKAWYEANKINESQGSGDGLAKGGFFRNADSCVESPLFVLSESGMIEWLQEYSLVEDIGFHCIAPITVKGRKPRQPNSTSLLWKGQRFSFHDDRSEILKSLKAGTGLEDFQAVYVPHCHGAMAAALTFHGGFKVSYSGDCRPSEDFVEIGQNSTVLIHEATFDDELRGDAKAKKHSTTSEAIGVGLAMNARRIILTHFSQRYQKIPEMSGLRDIRLNLESQAEQEDELMPVMEETEQSEVAASSPEIRAANFEPVVPDNQVKVKTISSGAQIDTKVAVAFDYMRVKVKDIATLEKFNPAFIKLYEGEMKALDDE